METRKVVSQRKTIQKLDGKDIFFEVIKVPIFHSDGRRSLVVIGHNGAKKDGSLLDVSLSTANLYDQNQNVFGVIAILSDSTE